MKVTDAAPANIALRASESAADVVPTTDLWWGPNATSYRLYQDGDRVDEQTPTPATPAAQHVATTLTGPAGGRRPTTGSPTLTDVAAEAGVSLTTASRVLHGTTRQVAESYRTRVTAAAVRLGYSTNHAAQAVARGASSVVSLAIGDVGDPYFGEIARGLTDEAEAHGLFVTMSATQGASERELAVVRAFRAQRPRAIILAVSRTAGDPIAGELERELVGFARTGGGVGVIGTGFAALPSVALPNAAGAAGLAEVCLARGYRRFAAVTGSETLTASSERLDGFRARLRADGEDLSESSIVRSDSSRDGAYAAVRRMLANGLDGTQLIFATSDVMAIGVSAALRDAGIRPGTDVAVCGFGDISAAADAAPSLTTVRLPLRDVGRAAVRAALGIRSTPTAISFEVIVRESTPDLRAV